jgi:hypothetical protein
MSPIIKFLTGQGPDHRGRYFENILKWDDFYLEKGHDYIQWIFPSDIPSQHFDGAPVLTAEDIKEMGGANPYTSELIHFNMRTAFHRFMAFYFESDYTTPRTRWLTPHDHNYKRLTRILRCLWICGMMGEYNQLQKILLETYRDNSEVIGETTFQYWKTANKGL